LGIIAWRAEAPPPPRGRVDPAPGARADEELSGPGRGMLLSPKTETELWACTLSGRLR